MNLPLDYRPEVRDEIDAAYLWHEQQRVGLGEEFLTVLRDQLDKIQDNPELYGVLYRQVRACPLRRFPYVVYFRIQSDRIDIIAVQHGHQNSSRWRRRA